MMLTKTIVRNYYVQNVGFYLLIFLLAFGFMKGSDHKHLILTILQAPYMLVYVSIVWALHVLKTNYYFRKNLTHNRNRFLKDLVLAKPSYLIFELLVAQLALNLPFMLYALAMISLGFTQNVLFSAFVIIAIQMLLVILPAFHLYYEIRRIDEPQSHILQIKWLPSMPPKLWFLSYLFRKQPLLFISLKFFAWCLIYGSAQLFPTDQYDYRLLNLGVWILSVGQFALGQEYYRYFVSNIFFEKNLPFSLKSRLINLLLMSFLLSLPELYLILTNWWSLIFSTYSISAYLYFFAMQTFWLIYFFKASHPEEKSDIKLYTAIGLIFFLIMFKVNLALIGTVFLIWGFNLFKNRYEKVESF